MPKLIGGIAALVALGAGILSSVEPVTMVWRAALAFMLGLVLTQLWYVFFTVRVRNSSVRDDDSDEWEEIQPEPPAAQASPQS